MQIQNKGCPVHSPNFIFFPPDTENPVIIDVGYGYTAEFGMDMIDRYDRKVPCEVCRG